MWGLARNGQGERVGGTKPLLRHHGEGEVPMRAPLLRRCAHQSLLSRTESAGDPILDDLL